MQYKFALSGSSQFTRSATGAMTLDQVNYVEFHADTWDYGFTLWVDGVQFNPCTPLTGMNTVETEASIGLINYPNPFERSTLIAFHLDSPGPVKLTVTNLQGRQIWQYEEDNMSAGDHMVTCDLSGLQPAAGGLYLLKMTTTSGTLSRKIVVIR